MHVSAEEQFILRVENRLRANSMLNARILDDCFLTMTRIGQCPFWLDSEIVWDYSFFLFLLFFLSFLLD